MEQVSSDGLDVKTLIQSLRLINESIKATNQSSQEFKFLTEEFTRQIDSRISDIERNLAIEKVKLPTSSCTTVLGDKVEKMLQSQGIAYTQPVGEKLYVQGGAFGINIPQELTKEYLTYVQGHEAEIIEFIINICPGILPAIYSYYNRGGDK